MKFLEEVHAQNRTDLAPALLNKLAANRKLPPEAFEPYEFGHSGLAYTFPVRNHQGKLVNLRMYNLGGKSIGTAGCEAYLYGAEELVNSPMTDTVYLCEGEWDTIAMSWLLRKLEVNAVAVGVPGASIFKREWANLFKNRDVVVCFDNDEAGEQGELLVRERLSGVANSVTYLHWPSSLPTGYDLRDFIASRAVEEKKPKGCYECIGAMLRQQPRKEPNRTGGNGKPLYFPKVKLVVKNKSAKEGPDVTFKDVENVFRKWLFLENTDAIKIALATVLSTRMGGDPVWLMLVAPPGGSKTEIINSLTLSPIAYLTSSLTPHTLISGAGTRGGEDLSMIPRLDGKCLCIKDFTVILNMRDTEKEEIFGTLRDAYDGHCGKEFGNGVVRSYKSHFSILAGVTPVIYNLSVQHAGLGERFLKFYIGDAVDHPQEYNTVLRAIQNISHESAMRREIAEVVAGYIATVERYSEKHPELPTIPDKIIHPLIHGAQYLSTLRGTVTRDTRNNEIVTSKPFREVATRLGKTFAKLLMYLARMEFRTEVNEDDYRLIRKIILDTSDQRAEELVRKLYVATPTPDDLISTKEIAFKTHYNQATISRILNDYNLLRIVERSKDIKKHEWRVSDHIRNMIEVSGMYKLEEERNRVRGDIELFKLRQEAGESRKKVILKKKRA